MLPVRVDIVEAAEELPVSLDDAKLQLRVDHNDDDAYISGLIAVAAGRIAAPQGISNRSLCLQTLRATMPCWPKRKLRLMCGPVFEIESVQFYDSDNAIQSLDDAQWFQAGDVLVFADEFSPEVTYSRPDAIQVTYTAGYSDPWDIPAVLRHVVLLQVTRLYEQRGEMVPTAVQQDRSLDEFLGPYRRFLS